ncbi:MAG TPA: hypothetical protein VIM58_01645 [Candidatus Methylacidiphilales bacterium]
MKRTFLLLAAAAMLALPALSLRADDDDDAGQGWPAKTVSWVRMNQDNIDVDGKRITLVGRVIQQHSWHIYFFEDETGTIELDSKLDLPVGQPIVIRGRIDEAYLHIGPLQVDVKGWNPAPAPRPRILHEK